MVLNGASGASGASGVKVVLVVLSGAGVLVVLSDGSGGGSSAKWFYRC